MVYKAGFLAFERLTLQARFRESMIPFVVPFAPPFSAPFITWVSNRGRQIAAATSTAAWRFHPCILNLDGVEPGDAKEAVFTACGDGGKHPPC